jgi:CheY-like chemotaxis protein
VQQLLRSWGFAVEVATNGTEALEKVAADPPGIILSDLVMPRMGGLDLLRALRQQHDEAFARTYAAERSASGDLTVVSEFVSGISLADLLDTSLEETVVPGVDAALGYPTESPPRSAPSIRSRVPHGLIAPTALFHGGGPTPSPTLRMPPRWIVGSSRRRLWTEFGIAAAPDLTCAARRERSEPWRPSSR